MFLFLFDYNDMNWNMQCNKWMITTFTVAVVSSAADADAAVATNRVYKLQNEYMHTNGRPCEQRKWHTV